ncbi:hypothetical protein L2E82_44747 [Cichorium intybus]|uniref:Uncharacterized protein n=1 Tax=Cichorium intybus TaxID=13427 RepID=A0ACB8ZR00_CICIN|nr:hypothetical protein L2E82_44747 [Cichorium intybus]
MKKKAVLNLRFISIAHQSATPLERKSTSSTPSWPPSIIAFTIFYISMFTDFLMDFPSCSTTTTTAIPLSIVKAHTTTTTSLQSPKEVLIYSPARTASQQGSGKVGKWKINFLSTQKWKNTLMGWTSTGDPYANVGDAGLSFESKVAAKIQIEAVLAKSNVLNEVQRSLSDGGMRIEDLPVDPSANFGSLFYQ